MEGTSATAPARPRLLIGVAAGLVGLATLVPLAGPARPAGADTTPTVPGSSRISGVDLQTYNNTGMTPNFQRIRADGANMVNITVWWEVPDSSTSNIVPQYGSKTISDVSLVNLAQQAESAGLQVTITPDFTVGNGGWRGGYDPPDPSMFFAGYTQMVDHYADIAQQLQLPMYWVDSEMVDSEKYTSEWESLIASVRQHYTGRLLYEANFGSLRNVQFYGALDAMSISAYFPLSNDADPSLAQLLAGWTGANPDHTNWLAVVAGAAQHWQKPIYFGEAGYSFSTYAAKMPWNEAYASSDPQLQYRCYQALEQSFRGQPWWGGVLWWSWDGGVYNMDGEPAESLIGTASVAYPAAPAPAPTPSPRPSGTGSPHPAVATGPAPSPASATGATAGGRSIPVVAGTAGAGSAQLATGGSTVPAPKGAAAPATGGAGAHPNAVLAPDMRAGMTPARHATRSDALLVATGIAVILLVLGWYLLEKRGWRQRIPLALGRRASSP